MARGQRNQLWVAGLVGVVLGCVLSASCQDDDPGQAARRQVAQELFTILKGDSLNDTKREEEVSKRIVEIAKPSPPPQSWKDMCAEAKELATTPETEAAAAILKALGADTFPAPNVENSNETMCSLTTFPDCSRFEDDDINLWLANLFVTISIEAPIQVNLSRFDLSSAVLFLDSANKDCSILFRARFYPRFDEEKFPVNLGLCQEGSSVEFEQAAMDFRNFVWYKDTLVALDLSEGSVLQELLLDIEEIRLVRTVFEEDLGLSVANINYFGSLVEAMEAQRIFVC